ncbi:MAG: methyltransferase, TrmH family [Solirubrobacterales bacterium]|nr:methyltransferase, TrmH family [Solirubrobacterales bacterium]
MITSHDNEKLKLVRKLHERKHREREGLFIAEGEDLLAAATQAGIEPVFALAVPGSESAGGAIEVEAELLAAASTLGSGTRAIGVFERRLGPVGGAVCVYLHGLGDPGNVGAIVRSTHALVDGIVVLGPGCADPFSPKAVRASMGSIFAQPLAQGELAQTPAPRVALVAHGGEPVAGLEAPLTLCLGAERVGLPADVLDGCERRLTIPLRDGAAESLNVAAAAAIALAQLAITPASERLGSGDA